MKAKRSGTQAADCPGPSSDADREFFDKFGIRILRALRKIIHAVDIHSRRLNQQFRITAPQLVCLHCVQQEGPMTLSRLAREVSLGASTVNGIVDRLEAKGFLTRTRSREDRRKVHVSVTSAGQEILRAAPDLLQDRFTEALQKLPELEQAAITLSLERVVELMGAEEIGSDPHLLSGNHDGQTTEGAR